MSECPVAIGDILADKYRVERVLGQGGMGVVVAAWHIELEQRVAVKFLLARFAQDRAAAERFRREARAAVKIKSEHVARVSDVGTLSDGAPYMVMEYLEGCDLETELARIGTFEIEEAVKVTLQACLAMAEAHAKGMVHRDLKPANLFRTTRADGVKTVKVLDFGISKSVNGRSEGQLALTGTAAMIGSPLYMSPEQLESSRDVTELADVWSLGVILYELLTGTVPFGGDTLPQLVAAVLKGEHTPAIDVRPDIPQRLSDTVSRCLHKDRAQRMPSVAQLAVELAAFMPEGERYSREVLLVVQHSALPEPTSAPFDPSLSGVELERAVQTSEIASAPSPATNRGGAASAGGTQRSAGSSYLDLDLDLPNDTQELGARNGTINSWGRTGGQSKPSEPRKKAWMPLAGAGLAALVVGVAAWFFASDGESIASTQVEEIAADSAEPATPTGQTAGAQSPKAEPDTPDELGLDSTVSDGGAAAAHSAEDPAVEAAGSAASDPSTPKAAEQPELRPSAAPPPPRPKRPAPKARPKKPTPAKTKTDSESAIPNFGGRR